LKENSSKKTFLLDCLGWGLKFNEKNPITANHVESMRAGRALKLPELGKRQGFFLIAPTAATTDYVSPLCLQSRHLPSRGDTLDILLMNQILIPPPPFP